MTSPKFHKLHIPTPLWDFLHFCEIYCTAACCEDAAFEQHHSLIRRKILDMNGQELDGKEQFRAAFTQLKAVEETVRNLKPDTEHDQLLVFVAPNEAQHQFQMNLDNAPSWFEKWLRVFAEVEGKATNLLGGR